MGHGHCQIRVWSACPWPASAADFEGVRGGLRCISPRLLAFARVPEDDLRGPYDKIAWDSSRCWVSPWRAPTLCRAMQRLARRCQAHPRCLGGGAAGQLCRRADETGWKQEVVGSTGCGSSRTCARTVYEILAGRGFDKAASVLGKQLDAGTLGVDSAGPPTVASRKRRYRAATTICCTVATSYWRRPRAGRCASHAWSRPSSGTPSPCAIGALLARSARMACELPRDSSRRR